MIYTNFINCNVSLDLEFLFYLKIKKWFTCIFISFKVIIILIIKIHIVMKRTVHFEILFFLHLVTFYFDLCNSE